MPQRRDELAVLPELDPVLEETEQIIRECFTRFQIDEVFLSFNGGKDCTVLLDLTLNVLRQMFHREHLEKELKVVYIRTKDPFSEIEEFVKEIEAHYGVTLLVTEGEMKTTLQRILSDDGKLKACLMGTRRTDPYSEDLKFMQKTDSNWPQMVRVSPLLNWSYHQVWSYILRRQVPYCNLYDKGYTSVGSTNNTWPNPALAVKDCSGQLSYLPAWRLADPTLERAGRTAPKTVNGQNGHANELAIGQNGHVNELTNGQANGHANGLDNGDTL